MEDTTKSKPFKKELQVKLTVDERLDYSDKLSREVQEMSRLEAAKSEVSKDYGAKIEAAKAQIGNISRIISNGYEYRPVECIWEFYWATGTKSLRRTDTKEEIKLEAISMEERQLQLDLEKKQHDEAYMNQEAAPIQTIRHEVVITDERAGQPGEVVDVECLTDGPVQLGSGDITMEGEDGCPTCKFGIEDDTEVAGWNCTHENGPHFQEDVCNNFEEKEE
jgi:hypothetical protein